MSKTKSVKKSAVKKRKQTATKKPLVSESQLISDDAMQETNEIPKFDLAEQIMAEHRKITAVKRKGPAKKVKSAKKLHPAESIGRNVIANQVNSGPQQIIAEIVARDIRNLCIGNTS